PCRVRGEPLRDLPAHGRRHRRPGNRSAARFLSRARLAIDPTAESAADAALRYRLNRTDAKLGVAKSSGESQIEVRKSRIELWTPRTFSAVAVTRSRARLTERTNPPSWRRRIAPHWSGSPP